MYVRARAHAPVGVPTTRDQVAEETGLPMTWEHFLKRRDKCGVGGTVFSKISVGTWVSFLHPDDTCRTIKA